MGSGVQLNWDVAREICDDMSSVLSDLNSELDSIYALSDNSDAVWQGKAATIFFDRFKSYNAELQAGYIDQFAKDIQHAIEIIEANKDTSREIDNQDGPNPPELGVGMEEPIADPQGHSWDDRSKDIDTEIKGTDTDEGRNLNEDQTNLDTKIDGTDTDEGRNLNEDQTNLDTEIGGTESKDNFESREINAPEPTNSFVENNTYNNQYFDTREDVDAEMDKHIMPTDEPSQTEQVETIKEDEEPSEIIRKLQGLINEVDKKEKGGV